MSNKAVIGVTEVKNLGQANFSNSEYTLRESFNVLFVAWT